MRKEPRRRRYEIVKVRYPNYRGLAVGYDFANWGIGLLLCRDGMFVIDVYLGPLWVEVSL